MKNYITAVHLLTKDKGWTMTDNLQILWTDVIVKKKGGHHEA
jgi:hypothetical protein